MAEARGVSQSTISSLRRSHNLKPHRVKTFKLSRDLSFLAKMTDVIGLYQGKSRSLGAVFGPIKC
jgi:hypothetical protein